MAIARHSPVAPLAPSLPKTIETAMRTTTVDAINTPLSSLSAFIQGSPWVVDSYYPQVLGEDNAPRDFDHNAAPTTQRYNCIKDFVLKVIDPLSSSTDNATGVTTVSGKANVYPVIVPAKGDIFFASSDGVKSLLRVTDVNRLTHNRESVFEISYVVTDNRDIHETELTLNARTNQVYHFHRERLISGNHALLSTEETLSLRGKTRLLPRLIDHYLERFFTQKPCSVILPYKEGIYYDPYLTRFLMGILELSDHPLVIKLTNLVSKEEAFLQGDSIYDVLLEHDPFRFPFLSRNKKMVGIPSVTQYTRTRTYKHAGLTGVMVLEPSPLYTDGDEVLAILTERTNAMSPAGLISEADKLQMFGTLPVSTYLFSDSFYNGVPITELEILLHTYIMENNLDSARLIKLTKGYMGLTLLEQFHYGPLLIYLLKIAIQEDTFT